MLRTGYWPVLCYALVMLVCTTEFTIGKDITVEEVEKHINQTAADLKCYVCNSLSEECGTNENGTFDEKFVVSCKDEYLDRVWGEAERTWKNPALGDTMRSRPYSLSELVAGGHTDPKKVGWVANNFPNVYSGAPSDSNKANRFSGIGNWNLEDEATFTGGFKSCRTLKIIVSNQINDGKRGEIPKEKPRVIRTCSFVDPETKIGKGGWSDNGCKIFSYKLSTVQVCYCGGAGGKPCNGAAYLRVSHWIIVASLVVLFVHFVNKN